MARNLVLIVSIKDARWREMAEQSNINKTGSDAKGQNSEWIDIDEAKVLEQKIRDYYSYYGNGFDNKDAQVADAMIDIGVTGALMQKEVAGAWKKFTDGCESALKSFYSFLGITK